MVIYNPEEHHEVGTAVPGLRLEVGTRLRKIEAEFKNREAAAAAAGVAKSTFQRWVEGKGDPSFEGLTRLSAVTGVSLDWLATGKGEMRASPGRDDGRRNGLSDGGQASFAGLEPGFVLVPRYDVRASAGPGALNDVEQVIDYMAFRDDFVRRVLRVAPGDLVLITAVGDSMEPAIRAGDLLLVDRGVERIIDDAIYVLVKKGELVVKRVQQFFNGAVAIKSDNPAYAEEAVAPGEVDQVVVAGRVRWIGRLI